MRSRLAFSNGSEFAIWQDTWCNECARDEAARRGNYENGCEILAAAVGDSEIPEWSDDPEATGWPRVVCSAFIERAGDEK